MAPENPLVPAGAWDTHIHVFEPDIHPYSPSRSYTPAAAPLTAYPVQITGCTNIVVVQATVQGTSPTPLLDLLRRAHQIAPELSLRGLAVLDLEHTTDADLGTLHAAGVRGVRMHEVAWGFGHQASCAATGRKLELTASRLNRLGWVLDLYMHPEQWTALAPVIAALPADTKVIADHFGGFRPGDEQSAEFGVFLDLVRRGKLFVKLSAFDRQYHNHPFGIAALEGLVRKLVEAGPDRLVFASDWPNTMLASSREGKSKEERLRDIEDFRGVDHKTHIKCLRDWIGDEAVWTNLWVELPRRLFA